jgi:hypothetical protein
MGAFLYRQQFAGPTRPILDEQMGWDDAPDKFEWVFCLEPGGAIVVCKEVGDVKEFTRLER